MSLIYNSTSEPRELIGCAKEWLETGRHICLATLINIEGNAPYPVGTQMLIDEQGHFKGQITGGCAEQAIAEQAKQAIQKGESQTHRYGLDSPYFDIKLPCGSGIDVFFDCSVELAKIQQLQLRLDKREPVIHSFANEFERRYLPSPRLVIAGQGAIMVHLAGLANHCGFDVALLAQNTATAELASQSGFQSSLVDEVALHALGKLDTFSAFVSLFHEHDLENPLLAAVLESRAFYIGALGSRRTHQSRLDSLSELGIHARQLDRIHGPVGIDIGAVSPNQIAVSILAELIQTQNAQLAT